MNGESNNPWDLPRGWEWVKFAEVARPNLQLEDSKNFPSDVHIAPNHIESGTGRLLGHGTIESDRMNGPKHRFSKGQILYSKIRPYLAKATLAPTSGLCSSDIYPVDTDLLPNFLLRWLVSPAFTEIVSQTQGRTVLPKVNLEALSKLPVPVAGLAEQHRIVAKLDSLLAKSRRAREALDAIPPLLEQLRQSVLASAFRGDLTADWRAKNPNVEPATELLKRIRVERRKKWEEAEVAKMKAKGKTPTDDKWKAKYVEPEPVDDSELPELPKGWCWAAAAEAVATDADIVYGIVQPGPVVADGVPYVRGMDIVNGVIQEQQLLRTHPDIAKRYERAALQGGDVLLGIIRATKVAVVPDTLVGANITQGTARFRPEKQLLSTSWFARWLESAWTQDWLHSKYRGIDMPGLNLADVRRLPIPVAPRSEQSALITCVEKHMLGLRRLVNEFVACQNATQNFPSALLAKAFRGDLVPQDPNDEPASVMLERLRAERDSEGNVAKKRGKGAAKEGTGNDQKELPGVEGASVSAKRGRKAKPKS